MNKQRIANTLAIFGLIIFTVSFSLIGWLKYRSFAFKDYDLALHAQTIWALAHGSTQSSVLGVPFLGNHAHFILFLLVPIYILIAHPVTLIALQAAASAWGGWILYRLSQRELSKSISLAILASYLLYPALGYINLFEFHPPVLSIPFVLLAFVAMIDNRPKTFVLWSTLACSCQENLPIIIACLGVYALLKKKSWPWVWGPFLGGLAYASFIIGWFIPSMNNGIIDFSKLYLHLGNNLPKIGYTLLITPSIWITSFQKANGGSYILTLLGPLVFLPLLDPIILLVLCSPSFFQHIFSARIAEHTIYFHYTAEIIPGLFLSMLFGLRRIMAIPFCAIRHRCIAVFIICSALLANLYWGPHLWLPFRLDRFSLKHTDLAKKQILQEIPKNAAVIATFELLPHLANRLYLYSFHHAWKGSYTLSNKAYPIPKNASLAVIDVNDPVIFLQHYTLPGFEDIFCGDARLHRDGLSRLSTLLGPMTEWKPVAHLESVVLFERSPTRPTMPLYQIVDPPSKIIGASIPNTLVIANIQLKPLTASVGQIIELTKTWVPIQHLTHTYEVIVEAIDWQKHIQWSSIQPPTHRIYPFDQWKTGEGIEETWCMLIPAQVHRGKYTLRLKILDEQQNPVPLHAWPLQQSDGAGRLIIGNIRIQ